MHNLHLFLRTKKKSWETGKLTQRTEKQQKWAPEDEKVESWKGKMIKKNMLCKQITGQKKSHFSKKQIK